MKLHARMLLSGLAVWMTAVPAACAGGPTSPRVETTPSTEPGIGTATGDARFRYGCQPRASSCAELTCTFDGSVSRSPAGPLVSWRWYFTRLLLEDNERETATRTGTQVTHTYTQVRCRNYTYRATLEVTDASGNTASHTEQVNPAKRIDW